MPTILIVDDERDFRDLLYKEAITQGYQVLVAVDGKEAVQKIKTEIIDGVLLDLVMPEMDGQEALYWIKQEKPDLPVIITTNMKHGPIPNDATEVLAKVDTTPKELIEKIGVYIKGPTNL